MAKPKLTVTTEWGTFTRSTARTYTHLVIVKGYRAERIEAGRLANIADAKKRLAQYRQVVATGQCQDARPGRAGDFDRECTAKFLAEGRYAGWIQDAEQEIIRLEAVGPITEDRADWGLDAATLAKVPTWGVLGWCGRIDLARKLATTQQAAAYRNVQIIDITTGKAVL